ncbi:hypothetical protein M0R45_036005 [Rubus argutus]|uniref:Molybdopterin synthase catalytic subunit n=1 Tax=Rubus argutus TaxID=59490 RepID=A0AAW1VYJ3_RUBAR
MADEDKNLVEILEEHIEIDIAKYINYVSAPQAVAHRLGPVLVGKTSVFIAVSSVHRVDALDACKFVIDEIKASVPIWKKEVYGNGEVWKENSEFLERRLDLRKKGSICNEKEVEAHRHIRKSCCGPKVKVVEGDSGISKNEVNQDL